VRSGDRAPARCAIRTDAAFNHAERRREASNEARRDNAPVRLVLAHLQATKAELEEGAARRLQIQPALFDHSEVGEQPGKDDLPLADERVHPSEHLFIR
jgi:predicted kinase